MTHVLLLPCQGMIHALRVIYREHGVVGLWRGSSAAVARVSVGSAAQLSTFSSSKEFVTDLQVRRASVTPTQVQIRG